MQFVADPLEAEPDGTNKSRLREEVGQGLVAKQRPQDGSGTPEVRQ
jgi:hypothetical protein